MTKDIEKALEKQFGKGIFSAGDQLLAKDPKIISVSPALNIILGGGIPQGCWVTMSGPPKVGKSTLALTIAKNAQEQGMMVYYFDVEGRLKKRDLEGITGLKTNEANFKRIGSHEKQILYAEQYLEILNSLVATERNTVFIFDSFSQLCSEAREANKGKRFRDDISLMLADTTKRLSNILPVTDNIVIGTLHLIANQNPQSRSAWTESGGNKIKYQADVRLKAPFQETYPKQAEKPLGQLIHWTCECTALNAPPNQKTKSLFRYGYGIDNEFELLTLSIDLGIVTQSGAWVYFPNEHKANGKEKARQYLVDNPEVFADITKQINEMLGI